MNKLLAEKCVSWGTILLFVLFLSLIVLYWFYPFQSFFYFWDQQLIHHPTLEKFLSHFFVWESLSAYPGSSTPVPLGWILYRGLMMFFIANLGPVFGQMAFVLLLLIATFIANYSFISSIDIYIAPRGFRLSTFIKGAFAFLLTLNIYSGLYLLPEFSVYSLFFLGIPLALTSYHQAIEDKKKIFIFALSALLVSQSFVQPAFLIVYFIYLFIYSIVLLSRFSIAQVAKHFVYLSFISLLVFAYILIPIVVTGADQFQNHVSAMGGSQYLDEYRQTSTITNVLNFRNFNLLFSPTFNTNYPQLYSLLESKFVSLLLYSSAFSLFCLIAYYAVVKKKRVALLTNLMLISSVLVSSAPSSLYYPLKYLWNKFPILQVLRIWDQKMGHFYLYFLLIVVFILTTRFYKNVFIKTIAILIIFIYSLFALPAVTGTIFFNRTQSMTNSVYGRNVSSRISIPHELAELNQYFKNKRDAKLLVLPVAPILSSDALGSTTYAATGIYSELAGVQATSALTYTELDPLITEKVYSLKSSEVTHLLQAYGYTHILIRKTQNKNSWFTLADQPDVLLFLKKLSASIRPVRSSHYFDLFAIDAPAVIRGAHVTYIRHNPTLYTLQFTNYPKSDSFIFFQSFRNGWKLYATPLGNTSFVNQLTPLVGKPVFDNTHMTYNGVFNKWELRTSDVVKQLPVNYYSIDERGRISFNLILYYQPQNSLYLGLLLTIGTVLVLFVTSRFQFADRSKHG